jgi:hypothetical protein
MKVMVLLVKLVWGHFVMGILVVIGVEDRQDLGMVVTLQMAGDTEEQEDQEENRITIKVVVMVL